MSAIRAIRVQNVWSSSSWQIDRKLATARVPAVVASHRSQSIPKLEPFSRSKIERSLKEPSLLQKSEKDILEYCSTLEGDASYSCWRAYFELKELEKKLPKEEVESLVIQSEGVKSLIGCLHAVTSVQKKPESRKEEGKSKTVKKVHVDGPCPIPDGLPKTQEEIEEEESARMPDSPFTRLLRSKGRHPAWYSQAPDHETD